MFSDTLFKIFVFLAALLKVNAQREGGMEASLQDQALA